jgi:hypothetical protein
MARKKNTNKNDVMKEEVVTIVYNDNINDEIVENDIIETEEEFQEDSVLEEHQDVETEVVTDESISEDIISKEKENITLVENALEEKIIETPKEPEVKKTNTNKNKCRFTFGYIWNGQEFDF